MSPEYTRVFVHHYLEIQTLISSTNTHKAVSLDQLCAEQGFRVSQPRQRCCLHGSSLGDPGFILRQDILSALLAPHNTQPTVQHSANI